MKNIYLNTRQKERYSYALTAAGYRVITSESEAAQSDYTVLDVDLFLNKEKTSSSYDPERTVLLSDEVTPSRKDALLESGISRVLCSQEPHRLVEYLDMLTSAEENEPRFFILAGEKVPAVKSTLKGLLNTFRCEPIFVESNDAFFEKISTPGVEFLLLNLGLEGLDINEFIRRAAGSMEAKRIPLITYRDMNDGIFINEFICGLNRLTRFILSTGELFHMLTDLLYRKEIIPPVHNLSQYNCLDAHEDFTDNPIARVYHQQRENLFSLPDIASPSMLEKIARSTRDIHNSVLKIEGLRWLIERNSTENINTCGAGG